MLIAGLWFVCGDGGLRPVLFAKVQAADGSLITEQFYVDTGADRTVLSARLLARLGLTEQAPPTGEALSGIGGKLGFVIVTTLVEFTSDVGTPVNIRGDFAAFKDVDAADLSILGRDVLTNFDVLVSRRRDEVLLLAGRHQYRVEAS